MVYTLKKILKSTNTLYLIQLLNEGYDIKKRRYFKKEKSLTMDNEWINELVHELMINIEV